MTRRLVVALRALWCALLVAGSTGCTLREPPPEDEILAGQSGDSDRADVLLWHAYLGREADALESVVDDFRAANPDVSVRVLAVPNEAYTNKLASAIPRGNGPDIFIGAHDQTGSWAEMQLLEALDDVPAETLDGFYPLTVEALRFDDTLYGLPLAFKSPVLIYNKALIAEPPANTDALLAAIEALTDEDAGEFGLVYEMTSLYYHSAWMHGFGGHVFDPESGDVDLANEGNAKSLEFARKLAAHQPSDVDGARIKQLFNDGKAAMIIDGPWALAQIDGAIDFGLATLPKIVEADAWAAPFVTAEGVFLSREARNVSKSRRVMDFIATDGAVLRGVDGKQTVAWKPAYDDPAMTSDAEAAAHRAVFVAQLDHAVVMSNRPEMSSVWAPAQQAISKALYGAPSGETPYWMLLGLILLITGGALVARGRDPSRAGGGNPVVVAAGGVCLLAVIPVIWTIASLYGSGGDVDPMAALAEAQSRYRVVQRPPAETANPAPYVAIAGLVLTVVGWLGLRAYKKSRAMGLEFPDNKVAVGYIAPAVLAMLLLVVAPFVVGTGLSFFAYERGEFVFVGLQNFERLIAGSDTPITDPLSFYFTLVVTVLWTALNVFFHVSIGMVLALLLRDPWLRMRGIYRVLLIIPWAVPNYITALIWRTMFDSQQGAINGILTTFGMEPVDWFNEFITSFAANLVTNTWLGFPFMMVVTLGALQSIPRDLEDAAAVDGANRWQRFRHVTFPLLQPALLPAVILGSVWTFNMFNIIYLVSSGKPDSSTEILISEAYKWAFERQFQYGYAAAYATIVFIILVLYSRATRMLLERNQ